MIYELRTTQVRPGGVAEFEKRLEASLNNRDGGAKLAGCWHSEIGPLLQVLELWVFEDQQHYTQASAAMAAQRSSLSGDDLVRSVEVEMLEPAPFTRALDGSPQKLGPIYELRIYQVKTGHIPTMIERWAPKLAAREELSPCLGAWHSESGKWFHIWPYKDLAQRTEVREDALRRGLWPPGSTQSLVSQETRIIMPAAFSPLQ